MGYREERSDWPDVPRDVMADEIDDLRALVNSLDRDLERALTLRPMETAPRDGSFILIQHPLFHGDKSDDAEIIFSLCHWDETKNKWVYSVARGLERRPRLLRDEWAHGWIPRPLPE